MPLKTKERGIKMPDQEQLAEGKTLVPEMEITDRTYPAVCPSVGRRLQLA